MVDALAKELELQNDYLQNKQLQTVYFGGGTPSILSKTDLEKLFRGIASFYDLRQVKEITFETNPDDITKENLDFWQSLGINRLSLGIQTFDEEYLKFMNRAHGKKEALKALELVMHKGFETSSADLIYSKTGFELDSEKQKKILKNDIEILTSFPIQHISAYNLTIEENTVFGRWKLQEIDDDYASSQYEIVVEELAKLGFEQYEISNFAKNKKYAVHNSSYWFGDEYLGIGPSAHSYNLHSRQWNVANNQKYMKAVEDGILNFQLEKLSISEKVNDYLLTGLRTIWGISLHKISQISAVAPTEFWQTLKDLENLKQIEISGDKVVILPHARILSDRIASELFWE